MEKLSSCLIMEEQVIGQYVQVWDRFIRCFHWSLAAVFLSLYCSAIYEYDETHFLLAYLLGLLLVSRISWGFTSSGYARFTSFIYPPSETICYIKNILGRNSRRYLGHNPAGALMIFTSLLLLIIMIITGFIMLTWGEYEGPLWAMGINFSDTTAKTSRLIHEVSTNLLLILIALHLAGVALSSLKHHENLVAAMWHGRKREEPEEE